VLKVDGQDVHIATFVGELLQNGLQLWVVQRLDVASNYMVDVMALLDLELLVQDVVLLIMVLTMVRMDYQVQ
jgi:hypothetical protein